MIRIIQIKIQHNNKEITDEELKRFLKKKASGILRIREDEIKDLRIVKHSIDARKKPVIFHIYVIDVNVSGKKEETVVKKSRDRNVSICKEKEYSFWKNAGISESKTAGKNKVYTEQVFCGINEWKSEPKTAGKSTAYTEQVFDERNADKSKSDIARENSGEIVVIGMGPAGLFCAYELAKNGFKVTMIDRGADVDKRQALVEKFWESGELDPETNVQFGEGGAGTFSDGKLNTAVRDKQERMTEALNVFIEHGAPESIGYESKPHIGTDILRNVVRNMRNTIIENGGNVVFECRADEILVDDAGCVKGVRTTKGDFECSNVVLAIGHSARDTFYMLRDIKVQMQPKPFAVGFRVEHPQRLINLSQYGSEDIMGLPAAPYKLTATTSKGRGVYSFCMCPGGYVVNASSEEGMLAVNGMSYSGRDGKNANSAIIITVEPSDFGDEDVLAGVEFQRKLEKRAFDLADGKIPVEYYGDFKKWVSMNAHENHQDIIFNSEKEERAIDRDSFCPQMKGTYAFADVHTILPEELGVAFVEGMESFGRVIKGYNDDHALISGVESRTSSPVRINRGEDGQSVNIRGLFPCGEGAGYAGGIMSAAIDGIRIAELIAGSYT